MSWLRRLPGRFQLHEELSAAIQSHLEEKLDELVGPAADPGRTRPPPPAGSSAT